MDTIPETPAPLRREISTSAPEVIKLTDILMNSKRATVQKNWHSIEHSRTREVIQHCIEHLIFQRKTSSSSLSLFIESLPFVANRVEKLLYEKADSFEEYNNSKSLISRLEVIVYELLTEDSPLSTESENNDNDNNLHAFIGSAVMDAGNNITSSSTFTTVTNSMNESSSIANTNHQTSYAATPIPITHHHSHALPTPVYPPPPPPTIATTHQDLIHAQTLTSLAVPACTSNSSTNVLNRSDTLTCDNSSTDTGSNIKTHLNIPNHSLVHFNNTSSNNTVSSQGCSRLFIVKVLLAVR